MREKEAHLETTWHDPRLGGQLSLRDLSTLEWRKTWLFPGIADAATRVEVRLRFLGLGSGSAVRLGSGRGLGSGLGDAATRVEARDLQT